MKINSNFVGRMYYLNPKKMLSENLQEYIELTKNNIKNMPDTIILPMSMKEITVEIDGFEVKFEKIQPNYVIVGYYIGEHNE